MQVREGGAVIMEGGWYRSLQKVLSLLLSHSLSPSSSSFPSPSLLMILREALVSLLKASHPLSLSCSDILRINSLNSDALYVKALCYYYQDMPDKANTFFQRALRADPDHRKSRLAIKVREENSCTHSPHMYEVHWLYNHTCTIIHCTHMMYIP